MKCLKSLWKRWKMTRLKWRRCGRPTLISMPLVFVSSISLLDDYRMTLFTHLIHRYSEIKSKEEFINTIRQVSFCSSLLKILEHLSRMLPRFDHHQQGSSTYKVHQTLFRSSSISIPACFYCSRMSMWQSTNYYNPNSWWQKMIFRMMMLSFIP